MKKLLLLFALLSLFSCSDECKYGGDPEQRAEILEEIEVLEEKRDNASTDELAATYQGQIDRKQKELAAEINTCE